MEMATIAERVEPLTRAQFELRLAQIEAHQAIAFKSAKTLNGLTSSAREIAMQRAMNRMVEDLVIQLEMETNVTVVVTRADERANSVPFPVNVKVELTMRNFDQRR